ncbi:MAG: hypothetical protein WD887_01825 [Candidatus Saccharimonadales bacterium]
MAANHGTHFLGGLMPDVRVLISDGLAARLSLEDLARIEGSSRDAVAREMSCENYAEEYEELDPITSIDYAVFAGCDLQALQTFRAETEIGVVDITSIKPVDDLIVDISAYDYPERMLSLNNRLKRIGHRIKKVLPQEASKVSLTFHRLQEGDWVSV